jgi:hypothetical protein
MTNKELAKQIQDLNAYLDKNPWDVQQRQLRFDLIDQLCNKILNP